MIFEDGCANTGEIASIIDHEWGHGLDQNDVSVGISEPSGEGIAGMPEKTIIFVLVCSRPFISFYILPTENS